jgi:hypothetical protein
MKKKKKKFKASLGYIARPCLKKKKKKKKSRSMSPPVDMLFPEFPHF